MLPTGLRSEPLHYEQPSRCVVEQHWQDHLLAHRPARSALNLGAWHEVGWTQHRSNYKVSKQCVETEDLSGGRHRDDRFPVCSSPASVCSRRWCSRSSHMQFTYTSLLFLNPSACVVRHAVRQRQRSHNSASASEPDWGSTRYRERISTNGETDYRDAPTNHEHLLAHSLIGYCRHSRSCGAAFMPCCLDCPLLTKQPDIQTAQAFKKSGLSTQPTRWLSLY
ncbi:hypothetical protein BD289DRAFT_244111 [Coniella lustricola]|uniref:Uncharacterized protein n=1 Tax=Coniella lustricola TaxID=2025994 RepID=A0A2T3A997_9PEZI|nr:hypothetical protein BD289DRAFT_244111 [Coniella lustricola]